MSSKLVLQAEPWLWGMIPVSLTAGSGASSSPRQCCGGLAGGLPR